jgi:hypothetical protein
MRIALIACVVAATAVAACDQIPTSPEARPLPDQAKPSALLVGTQWVATKLPFQPAAINDAGVVVGTQTLSNNSLAAVRWQGGVTTRLLAPTDPLCQGNSTATAISPAGRIAGTSGQCAVAWPRPDTNPTIVPLAHNKFHVIAVSDVCTLLIQIDGSTPDSSFVFSIDNVSFITQSPLGFIGLAADAVGNVYGYTVGGHPARWSAAQGLVHLPVPTGYSSGSAIAADSRGDALGMVRGVFTQTMPVLWSQSGSVTKLAGLPAHVSQINDAGRLVGYSRFATQQVQVWTSFQGSLTVLNAPDASDYTTTGVNNCGSIIASAATGPLGGALFRRSSITPVCDQPPVSIGASRASGAR